MVLPLFLFTPSFAEGNFTPKAKKLASFFDCRQNYSYNRVNSLGVKMIHRYLFHQIDQDLNRKMVFLGGPRQVGKTTLAKMILAKEKDGVYISWDVAQHREQILRQEIPEASMLVLDELHKYKQWRQYVKGIYDLYGTNKRILVTGSARLDYYRHGGDSLQGRYHYLRMLPLSAAELQLSTKNDLDQLFTLGGFPEPFFSGSEVQARRWSREYRQRLIQEDIVNLENTTSLQKIELMMLRLPDLIGSPLSLNSLREDLDVSHKAISNWIEIMERLYAIFRIPPFHKNLLRAVKKEQKHYHFDWTVIKEKGIRFENMVAVHLLKWVLWNQDVMGKDMSIQYFRDIDGREVDFIITEDTKPIVCIECKLKDEDPSKHLLYFIQKFPFCKAWQITMDGTKNVTTKEGIRIAPALEYLTTLV
jgi:uncharacterized protein